VTIAQLIILLLASYGLSFALIDATILEWPRSIITKIEVFRELLHCYFCTGFWAGIIVALIAASGLGSFTPYALGLIVIFGFASATSSYAIQLKLSVWESQQQIYELGSDDGTD